MEPDDEFADLDAIIADSEQRKHESKTIGSKYRRLATPSLSQEERDRLSSEIHAYEELYVWRSTAAVAMFHSQHCNGCGHDHKFFLGWMTAQDHRQDPNCRRLIRGQPVEALPRRIECHAQPPVELCGDCVESQLLIDNILERCQTDGKL